MKRSSNGASIYSETPLEPGTPLLETRGLKSILELAGLLHAVDDVNITIPRQKHCVVESLRKIDT